MTSSPTAGPIPTPLARTALTALDAMAHDAGVDPLAVHLTDEAVDKADADDIDPDDPVAVAGWALRRVAAWAEALVDALPQAAE